MFKPMDPASSHKHLFIVEDEQGRREFILDAPIYAIGRDPKCEIRLFSQFASRRHATLVQLSEDDGQYSYRIVDGNLKGKLSSNGLLINGQKLRAHDLRNEDEIIFASKVRAVYYLISKESRSRSSANEFDATVTMPLPEIAG